MDSLFGLDRIGSHDDSSELLITAYDAAQLMIWKSILQDADIPYFTKDRGAGTSVKVIAGFSVFGTDIFVRKEDRETALALITPPEELSPEEAEDEHD